MSTVFPKWWNQLPIVLGGGGLAVAAGVVGLVWYYFTPKFWEVGYQPIQPGSGTTNEGGVWVGFSHEIHAGKLGMDCRYCHTHVEESAEANVPNVATCMGCHTEGRVGSEERIGPRVQFVRSAYEAGARFEEVRSLRDEGRHAEAVALEHSYEAEGLPVVEGGASIPWRRVHKLPDYVRNFPHHVHVKAGVSCYSCHGMIPTMGIVRQVESLSMGWCLDCHRASRNETLVSNLVPPEKVTDLFWVERVLAEGNGAGAGVGDETTVGGAALLSDLQSKKLHLLPENCGACHY